MSELNSTVVNGTLIVSGTIVIGGPKLEVEDYSEKGDEQ